MSAGDLLVEFDIKEISQAGFDLVTPIIITNTDMYEKVETSNVGHKNAGEFLMKLFAKSN